MSSQLSAQAITAQTAITRMSIRRCSILPRQRGSSTTLKCRTKLSMDMILSSPARGHVIIHQARASDRNFMRLPWAGELVFHVFGAIAHFERRLIAERTRDGVAAARAEGRKPGRKPLDPEKLQA